VFVVADAGLAVVDLSLRREFWWRTRRAKPLMSRRTTRACTAGG